MTKQIQDKIRPLPTGSFRCDGFIEDAWRVFSRNRIFSDYARNVICREAEDAFFNKLDDSSGVIGIWQGEYWGKWAISAARAAQYECDDEMKAFLRASALRILSQQNPETGYLGCYRNEDFVLPADPKAAKAAVGKEVNWNWNVWCRKYTLWGLLEVYTVTGDRDILVGAEKLMQSIFGMLKRSGLHLRDTGTFCGIASGSILKPVMKLYEATGKPEYLEFARNEIVRDWDRADGLPPNLIANALTGKAMPDWYEGLTTRLTKVYETLSAFDGLIEYYRVTGERRALDAAAAFHDLTKKYELNVIFGMSINDLFGHAADQELNAITEPCDLIHWMRLNYELFTLTGKREYMDDFELCAVNGFFASGYRDGRWGARGIRSHGHHLTAHGQAQMTYQHCCVNNMPRGFMNYAQAQLMKTDDALLLNFYTPYHAKIELPEGSIALRITGDYLGESSGLIVCDAVLRRPVVLKCRIPGWAVSAQFEVNGTPVEGTGEYTALAISCGRTEIRFSFGRRLKIRHHKRCEKGEAYCRERWIEPGMEDLFRQDDACSMVYGPLLLARSRIIANSEEEMFGPRLGEFTCKLTRVPCDAVNVLYDAEITTADGRTFHTNVCDFASAGNMEIPTLKKYFSIYF